MSVQSRVDLGCQLLDREVSDWRDRIDSAILDIRSPLNCLIGQLFESATIGFTKLDLWDGIYEFGFDGNDKGTKEQYISDCNDLTEEWKQRLISRSS